MLTENLRRGPPAGPLGVPAAATPSAPRKRIAIFAPHLMTPIRNGGDVYIWRKWGALDPARFEVTLFAADAVYRLGAGGWEGKAQPGSLTMHSRPLALVTALVRGCDYLSAKFNTQRYLNRIREEGGHQAYDLSVYSLASTYGFVAQSCAGAGAVLIETHNYDPKFYLDRAREARTAAGRLASCVAAGRAHDMVCRLPPSVPLVALGEMDAQIYRALGHETVLVSRLGYEVASPRTQFPEAGALAIAFVGSLSVSMNEVAIRRFATSGLPLLRQALGTALEVHVAGSRPSAALAADLGRCGITVHADLEDEVLRALLERCHATILPFESSNGMKLKFALSAGLGIPMMSYIPAPPELASATGVLTSQDMRQWADFLVRLRQRPALEQAACELQGIACAHSWRATVETNLHALQLDQTGAAH